MYRSKYKFKLIDLITSNSCPFSCLIICIHIYYRPQRSCGQGYVFTRVCDSVHRGVSGEPPLDQADPPGPGRPPPGPGRPPLAGRSPPGPRRIPPGPRRTPPDQGEPPRTKETPAGRRLKHTVNERPVHILLECILVHNAFLLIDTSANA